MKFHSRWGFLTIVAATCATVSPSGQGPRAEWNQWRGPSREGVVAPRSTYAVPMFLDGDLIIRDATHLTRLGGA